MSMHPTRLREYELRERLGDGPTGEVWKGFDTRRQRTVAIKILHVDPEALSRFHATFLT